MKIRNGFVSNSSSSCYILNFKDEKVKNLMNKINNLPAAEGLHRMSAMSVGQYAIEYANDWIKEMGEDSRGTGLGYYILNAAKERGEENVVFVRFSDEDGYGEDYDEDGTVAKISKLAICCFDYH